ncbi:type II toxin-antitoxin system VapC family toxin [Methylobacter sp.]|uniref:type II toxin-antitoxin system VapC family toxin n=1 Tax=Methylobacter sp. TaxID=2051955 RepID=UPI002FDD70A9
MADFRYLLDTNIVSELIKNPRGSLAENMLRSERDQFCCTSIIVACELRYGAAKKQSPKLSSNVEQILNSLPVLPLENTVDEVYAKIRTDLEQRGLPIGHNDLLIAAHALSLGLTVVTANEREFSRVDQLIVENWLNA